VATGQRKTNLCKSLSTASSQAICVTTVAAFSKQPALCNALTGVPHDQCVSTAAIDASDYEACASIQATTARAACQKDVARSIKDPQLCDRLTDDNRHDECLNSIVEYKAELVQLEHRELRMDLCARVRGQAARDVCYSLLAKKDPPACENVGEGEESAIRRKCYAEIPPLRWLTIDCSRIDAPQYRAQCWVGKTRMEYNPALCDKIDLADERDRCISRLAQDPAGRYLCLHVRNPQIAAECVLSLEHRELTTELCRLIPAGAQRDDCTTRIPPRR
jgi:hypothetical protein